MDTMTEETKEEEGGLPPPAEDDEPDIFELEGMSELDLSNGACWDDRRTQGERDAARGRGGWEGGGRIRPATPQDKVGEWDGGYRWVEGWRGGRVL